MQGGHTMGLFSRRKNQKPAAPAAETREPSVNEEEKKFKQLPAQTAEEKTLYYFHWPKPVPGMLEDVQRMSVRQQSWRGMFGVWLAHYIGLGVPADQVVPGKVEEYLEANAYYQAACQWAQKPYDLILKYLFPMYLNSGINWKYDHTPEKSRMVGLFHAVANCFLIEGNTWLSEQVDKEAGIWQQIFARYPGADRNDPDWKLMVIYFMCHNPAGGDARIALSDDVIQALEQNVEDAPVDSTRLFILARDELHNGPIRVTDEALGPDGMRVKLLMYGANAGNAACAYLCLSELANPVLRQKWYDFYRELLPEAEDQVKGFLDKLAEKGDEAAAGYKTQLENDGRRCQGEIDAGLA